MAKPEFPVENREILADKGEKDEYFSRGIMQRMSDRI